MLPDTVSLRDGELFLRLTGSRRAHPERGWLPTWYFDICLDGGARVGRCELRVGANARTALRGNVGYLVHPRWRGHRYAARACRLLFQLARALGMRRVVITCDAENLASRRTCELAGATLAGVRPVPPDSSLYAEGKRFIAVYEAAP